jgi:hypothetical protein
MTYYMLARDAKKIGISTTEKDNVILKILICPLGTILSVEIYNPEPRQSIFLGVKGGQR